MGTVSTGGVGHLLLTGAEVCVSAAELSRLEPWFDRMRLRP